MKTTITKEDKLYNKILIALHNYALQSDFQEFGLPVNTHHPMNDVDMKNMRGIIEGIINGK